MSKHPLPEQFVEIRKHQADAREEIDELFKSGKQVVIVDAPTGSGKSLLGELARRDDYTRLDGCREGDPSPHKTLYLCGTKGLQDQFATDFDYGKVIKGRANYPTQHEPMATGDDCLGQECWMCDSLGQCPYRVARSRALNSELAIANYAYLLGEANTSGNFSRRSFAIADECDMLEGELLRHVEFYLSARRLERLGIDPPKKAVRKPTLVAWLGETFIPTATAYARRLDPLDLRAGRERRALEKQVEEAGVVAAELEKDIEAKNDGDEGGVWVRDYPSNGVLSLKPVIVKRYGMRKLFRHADRWLLMSATVISAQDMMDSLGCGLEWGQVQVPMTFGVENRPVHVTPMGSMARKSYDETLPKVIRAVERICERHRGERVLVHTHTYKLARELMERCYLDSRPVFTYSSSHERDDVFKRYAKSPGGVLFAPSMDRGYDFAGDLARVVVIAKVPYGYLGDAQIGARLRLPGGQTWYTVQTVRSIVQMTGRGVRSASDHAEAYILDSDFLKTYRGGDRLLYPEWWRSAVNMGFPVKELL